MRSFWRSCSPSRQAEGRQGKKTCGLSIRILQENGKFGEQDPVPGIEGGCEESISMAGNSVTFTLQNAFAGFVKCEGLIRDEGEFLSLEYEIKDPLAGILKTGVKKMRIPVKDLVSITLTKGWLGNSWLGIKIVIKAANLETLQEVPSASQGRVDLSISVKDRDAAEKFVAELHEEEK
jgi:hypothetical protein